MASGKTTKIKPIKEAKQDFQEYARRAKQMRQKFIREGKRFPDSAALIREDRESRDLQ